MKSQPREKVDCKLRVAFLLTPSFTLTAFAGFVDALRLAADEGDRSRPLLARWAVLDASGGPVLSSCGASVAPNAPLDSPQGYDYLVVVGGLLHGGQRVPARLTAFLRQAAAAGVKLVGLCTGSFVLARAGLLDGHVACVSWFHREEFTAEFPECRIVSNQMFVVDRDRLTCAGGTSVVHLAAHVIERTIGRASAVKALRIMIEEQPLPSRTLQPEQVLSVRSTDTVVHKAMLLLEQQLHTPATIEKLCKPLGIGRRQLERRFQQDVGLSPAEYRQQLRLERARWLLQNTDLEVTEVALECGFQDGASFARVVRKALGSSPREVRQAARTDR
ncbi:GlxA family transcriptional regulator [Variovorax paradoxus]|uniref:GlxA family transcriptional regulator n=1 Tax=Variovorax paradoxus TaxID=34073 RepID=UPI0027831EC7|nr:GlxA family transcriptional regulator [Variovorax paradoxus]MDQ0588215.1 transcriptional regulator GlxA family with amidase domain [Variovorax paradoxus]